MFAEDTSRAHRPCPGCGEDRPRPAFSKYGFELARCGSCDTLYVTPGPTPSQLTQLYVDSPSARYWSGVFFPAVAEARRVRIFRPRVARVLDLVEKAGLPLASVTEVGAGAGIFLDELRVVRPDTALSAIEPGHHLAQQCRGLGFATFEGFIEDAASTPQWRESADLIVCFEVLEHTLNSLDFVTAASAVAKPGGLVIMSGLSGDGFDIRVLGARANAIAPPHHLTFLSRKGAHALMRRAGFDDIHVFTPGELDVDIVANALKADDGLVTDPFLRELLLGEDEAARVAFQAFLKDAGLSSHMWIVCRKAGAP